MKYINYAPIKSRPNLPHFEQLIIPKKKNVWWYTSGLSKVNLYPQYSGINFRNFKNQKKVELKKPKQEFKRSQCVKKKNEDKYKVKKQENNKYAITMIIGNSISIPIDLREHLSICNMINHILLNNPPTRKILDPERQLTIYNWRDYLSIYCKYDLDDVEKIFDFQSGEEYIIRRKRRNMY